MSTIPSADEGVTVRLSGVHISNFRSIGPDGVTLRPLRRCNVLVGANNSGKSTVLRALQLANGALSGPHPGKSPKLEQVDYYRRDGSHPFSITLYFEAEANERNAWTQVCDGEIAFTFSFEGGDVAVSDFSVAHQTDANRIEKFLRALDFTGPFHLLESPTRRVKALNGQAMQFWHRFPVRFPAFHLVPEFRQIAKGDKYTFDGRNLIELLETYRSPEIGKDDDREKFLAIERFVRELLGFPDAALEVTSTNKQLVLRRGPLRLPLSSYGTGVHELVILVTAVLSVSGEAIGIEEPEIHLHHSLQRKLVEFILAETSNLYFITSHSPIFLDVATYNSDVSVVSIRSGDNGTIGGVCLDHASALATLRELGVFPSDLLQANYIVWVEGPSDRLYLRRWLALVAPDLQEGRHFQVVFYGGKVLAHFSANPGEDATDEFIRILRVSNSAALLMDSDLPAAGGAIRATKKRIVDECSASGTYAWVTDGREIENYLHPASISSALLAATGTSIDLSFGAHDRVLDVVKTSAISSGIAPSDLPTTKVEWAAFVSPHIAPTALSAQLRAHLDEVVERIRVANGHSVG